MRIEVIYLDDLKKNSRFQSRLQVGRNLIAAGSFERIELEPGQQIESVSFHGNAAHVYISKTEREKEGRE